MSLTKVNYIDNSTIITAKNLNDIQDNIIQNAELIKKAAPRNLLDNSDFRNPVNQRGFVSGTGGEANYTIDRWWLQYDTILHLHEDCIGISRYWDLKQYMGCKFYAGKTYTFACEAKSEADSGNVFMRLGKDGGTGRENRQAINNSEWTKCVVTWTCDGDYEQGEVCYHLGINTGNLLETQIFYKNPVVYEGEYTIDTLPEYQPKGYENELLICKQYSPETGEYVGIPEVVNNFTTTEEGFVADARALKVLNDRTLQNNTYVIRKDTYSGVGSIVINVKVKNDGKEYKIPISIYGVDNNIPCFGCVCVILRPSGEIYVRGFLQELFVIDMTQIRSKVLQCTGTINEDSVTLTISDFDLYGRYIFSCHDYIIE